MGRQSNTAARSGLGALGVVFGDIGTSPLYALPAAFWLGHFETSTTNVLGIVSLIVWSITVIVSIKYIGFMMHANNHGEGGIMALVALIRRALGKHRAKRWTLVGMVGIALFYGDSVITPAISVLSAVEGLEVALPALASWIVPISLLILVGLFAIQSRGTARLGRWFGPVMLGWFLVSAVAGIAMIIRQPLVLFALSPLTALEFVVSSPTAAFVAMGAVVLSVTGAEALYADMGHFGRAATTRSWLYVVYPALVLNYLGQGAYLLLHKEPTTIYFRLFPDWALLPVVVLATAATLVASQSVIAGAFSLTRQAVQLGLLPKLRVRHTSDEVGQVYIAGLNWMMFVAVALLVLVFGSSTRLADAYGMAESGTLLASSVLLVVAARYMWPHRRWVAYGAATVFICFEVAFVAACSVKLAYGAWIPLAIAACVLIVLTTWTRGSELVARERHRREGKLRDFVARMPHEPQIARINGTAIYLAHHPGFTPLALHATVEHLHELSRHVIIVTVETANVPHIAPADRAEIDNLGNGGDGVVQVKLRFGFNEAPNVPRALEYLHGRSPELNVDPATATYFISDSDIVVARHGAINRMRARLFANLHRIAAPSPTYFHLPPEQTIDMASYVAL